MSVDKLTSWLMLISAFGLMLTTGMCISSVNDFHKRETNFKLVFPAGVVYE